MRLKRVPARFYLTSTGANPVRSWLMELPPEDRHCIGHDLRTVEYGWPLGMPLCRSLGEGLWEVRSTLPSRRIARVLLQPGGRRTGSAARLHQENAEDPAR